MYHFCSYVRLTASSRSRIEKKLKKHRSNPEIFFLFFGYFCSQCVISRFLDVFSRENSLLHSLPFFQGILASGYGDKPIHSSNRDAPRPPCGHTGESASTRSRGMDVRQFSRRRRRRRCRSTARPLRCNFRPGRRVGLMSNLVPINFTLELILDL